MNNFAPAPWKVVPYVDGIDIVDADGKLVARVADRAIDGKGLPPANGYLIAVSPELLAGCEMALPILESLDTAKEDGDGDLPEVAFLKAAIAKAKGGAS